MEKDTTYIAIIPARYASTRFPGKPLQLLGGKPIIQHVWERAKSVMSHVFVATDDERIAQCVEQFGGKAVMTSTHHRSGTDRCREAYEKCGIEADVVVNIQGDEPFIAASQLETLMRQFDDAATDIATLVRPFGPTATFRDISNPNTPKVVVSREGFALYFSRSVIPYLRGVEPEEWASRHEYLAHIGLYAYRTDTLQRLAAMAPGLLEQAESLEQLRWLEAGLHIKVGRTDVTTIGIDTPEDLQRAEAYLARQVQ